jgi:uncharacterized YigZ family protein
MLFEDTYRTINRRGEGMIKDRGSKFIGIVLPVHDETEARRKLGEVRNEYHDARHHCFAYVIGSDKSVVRYNDDGEPSGTAGRPILGQIRSKDLTNVLVVVVRYFGGTKLGVRGLINAYKSSAYEAIKSTRVVVKTIDEVYTLHFDYPAMNQVMQCLKNPDVKITAQDFAMKCTLTFRVRKNRADEVTGYLKSINNLEVRFLHSE